MLKNERGYTLVLVLLMITLMFTLGALLINKDISLSKQVASTEKYHRSVSLAEEGTTYAKASIQHTLETIDIDSMMTTVEQSSGSMSEEEIAVHVNEEIAQAVMNNMPEKQVALEDDSFTINVELKNVEVDEIIFAIQSTGKAEREYTITAEIVIATEVIIDSSGEGTGGQGGTSGDYDDPHGFADWEITSDDIIASIILPEIPHNQTGGTLSGTHIFDGATGFDNAVTLTSGTLFTVNDSLRISGIFTANGADEINIKETAEVRGAVNITDVSTFNIGSHATFAGGPNLTNSVLHIGGNLNAQGSITLDSSTLDITGSLRIPSGTTIKNGSVLTVGEEMAMNSILTIQNSAATFNGYTALNSLTITGATETIRARNMYIGSLSLTNTELLVDGSFRAGWSNTINNATLTVQGHFLAGGTVTLGSGSTIMIYGDAEFTDYWNSLSFSGTGARVIIYGEGKNYNDTLWNATFKEVGTLDDCVVVSNTNMVYFVGDNPPTGGGEDGSGTSGDVEFSWDDVTLQNVEYDNLSD